MLIHEKEYTPDNIPDELKSEANTFCVEYTETLHSFFSEEKLCNLVDDFYNTDYYRALYYRQIAYLYFFLNEKDKAEKLLDESLMACQHPEIALNLALMCNLGFVTNATDPQVRAMYYLKVLQCNVTLLGSRTQRKNIESALQQMDDNFIDFKTSLINVSNMLFEHYITYKNTIDIEILLTSLCTSPQQAVVDHGKYLLGRYLENHLFSLAFGEIDRILLKFNPWAETNHYAFVAEHAFKIALQKQEHAPLAQQYLEKPAAMGDISSKANLAFTLIYSRKEIARALDLIREVQKHLRKLKDPELEKNIQGLCFHLLGRVYDLGLLPPVYAQNDEKAAHYYTQAIQFDYPSSLHDLAIMYHTGQGIPQDLEKSAELLTKAIELSFTPSRIELAMVRLLQAASALNNKEKYEFLTKGIAIVESLNFDEMSSRDHFIAAFLFLSHDLKIALSTDNKDVFGFTLDALFKKNPECEYTHVEAVKAHLLKAAEQGENSALNFLGCLFHAGNYFNENLDEAEKYYKEYIKNAGIPISLTGLYLLRSARAESNKDKQALLLVAIRWHRYVLKHNTDPVLNLQLETAFSKFMQAYYDKKDSSEWLSIYQCQEKFRLANNQEPIKIQLSKAIKKAENCLNNPQSDNFEAQLLESFSEITFILKISKNQVPSYIAQLKDLEKLQCKLQSLFINLSINIRCELIKCCSQWPLLNERDGALSNMLLLTQTGQLTPSQKMSLGLAMTHLKHDQGLFENDFLRLFLNINTSYFHPVSNAARLIYIFALGHANANNTLSPAIQENMNLLLPQLITYLNDHCQEANSDDMSQIYHGINYLRLIYPEQLTQLPEKLNNFMQFNHQILARSDAVTISKQQQRIYDLLSELDSRFRHEELIGGRRVDFFNPKTNTIVFYHGPSHYLYKDGKPCELNPATIFCQNTLKKQGKQGKNYIVLSIYYSDWARASTREEQINLLRKIIPSLPKPAARQSLLPTKTQQPGARHQTNAPPHQKTPEHSANASPTMG